jgi:hypothetical protein
MEDEDDFQDAVNAVRPPTRTRSAVHEVEGDSYHTYTLKQLKEACEAEGIKSQGASPFLLT